MQSPRLYLFVGAPGAGKTTIAHLIERTTGATHLWADQERQAMFNTVTHSKTESDQLYSQLNARTEQLLAEGKSVIFDTNFNYLRDRQRLAELATKHHAATMIIWLTTPRAVAKARALHDHHRNRNGYQSTMTSAEFDRLVDHLEPPTDHETFITIDGTNIDESTVIGQLGLI